MVRLITHNMLACHVRTYRLSPYFVIRPSSFFWGYSCSSYTCYLVRPGPSLLYCTSDELSRAPRSAWAYGVDCVSTNTPLGNCTKDNFPLVFSDVEVVIRPAPENLDFLRRFLPKLEWDALVDTARSVCQNLVTNPSSPFPFRKLLFIACEVEKAELIAPARERRSAGEGARGMDG